MIYVIFATSFALASAWATNTMFLLSSERLTRQTRVVVHHAMGGLGAAGILYTIKALFTQ